jgi:nitroreductase/NAD-dependent dihydropyrimidine dehydrogenase PreA subunit
MSLIAVDPTKCKRDATCVATCPMEILRLDAGATVPEMVAGGEEQCVKCGHCVAVCPHEALSHQAMSLAGCPPIRQELMVSPEQAEQFLRSRRSIRAYQDRAVERSALEKLIAVARHAPTASNGQRVHWIVLGARDQVKKLAGKVIDMLRDKIAHQPAAAARFERHLAAWDAGHDRITRGAPVLLFTTAPRDYGFGAADCAIALSHLDLAAPSLGFGTCWAGYVMLAANSWPPLLEGLAIPEGHACFGAMMVGYPKHRYHRLPQRNQASVTWLAANGPA